MLKTSLLIRILILGTLASLFGCAGSGGGPNVFAGSYQGIVDLGEARLGTLLVSIDADGTATGTLVVDETPPLRSPDGLWFFPTGGFPLSGGANAQGMMILHGNLPVEGEFTVSGTLPQGSGPAAVTVEANGESFNGTIEVHSSTGGTSLTFTPLTSTNALLNKSWTATSETTFSIENGMIELEAIDEVEGYFRIYTIRIPVSTQPGQSISLTNFVSDGNITYNESQPFVFTPRAWSSTSGTLTLISKTSTSAEIQITNVKMDAVAISGNLATGSFKVEGTAKN